jgi:hypothetical protein
MTDDELLAQAKLLYLEWRLCPETTGSSTPIADLLVRRDMYKDRDTTGKNSGMTLHDVLMRVIHHGAPLTKETLDATRSTTARRTTLGG